MKIYNYDYEGYLTVASIAMEDPLDKGRFLIPAHATDQVPPEPMPGQKPRFVGGWWTLDVDPEVRKAQEQLEGNRLVIFYRNSPGLDTKVLGGGRRRDVRNSSGQYSYGGRLLSDPANAEVAVAEFEQDPPNWNAKNSRDDATKKVVDGAVVDRLPADILMDDPFVEARRVVVFYKDKPGYDTRVITALSKVSAVDGSGNIVYPPSPSGEPITDAGYVILPADSPLSLAEVLRRNSAGVIINKVDPAAEAIVPRAAEDIAKDRDNSAALDADADKRIKDLLKLHTGQEADFTTHLMIVQASQDVLLAPGSYTQSDIDRANDTLAVYRPLFAEIQAVRSSRDAAIAALEQAG